MQICLLSTRTFPRKEVKRVWFACLLQDSHLHHMKLSHLRTISVEHLSHDSHMVVLLLMNKNRISLMVTEHMECELFSFCLVKEQPIARIGSSDWQMLEPFFGHPNEYVLLQLLMPRYGQTRIRSVSLWLRGMHSLIACCNYQHKENGTQVTEQSLFSDHIVLSSKTKWASLSKKRHLNKQHQP